MDVEERLARIGLSAVVEGGTTELGATATRFGAEEVWERVVGGAAGEGLAVKAGRVEPAAMLEAAAAHGIRFVVPGDREWPDGLAGLDSCEPVRALGGSPIGLWVRGEGCLAGLAGSSVAIVGARAATAYGETVAADLGAELSQRGVCVISGGAYGIDAAAHRGALSVGGATAIFLAGGVDQPYPAAHRQLFGAAAEKGVVVSEVPPGAHPTRMRFLARNRLIAATAGATVLVEAAVRSGARNTASWASSLQRVVMAVPGPVTSALSFTPHRLIREGEAVLVTNAAEVLELLPGLRAPSPEPVPAGSPIDELNPNQLLVMEELPARGGRSVGELAVASGLPVGVCLAIVGELERQGHAVLRADGLWHLQRPVAQRNPSP